MGVGGLVLALAWIGGTVLGLHAALPPWPALLIGVGSLGLVVAGHAGPVRLGALALGSATLALARVGFSATVPVQIDMHGPVTIVGQVADVPAPWAVVRRSRSTWRLSARPARRRRRWTGRGLRASWCVPFGLTSPSAT